MEWAFRLLATSSPDCGSLIWPRPTGNIDHHQAVNHLQFPAFPGFPGVLWAKGPVCSQQIVKSTYLI